MKTIVLFLVVAVVVILAPGCKKTVFVHHAYVEEETPPGTVPPPHVPPPIGERPAAVPQAEPERGGPAMIGSPVMPAQAIAHSLSAPAVQRPPEQDVSGKIVGRFKEAYAQKGRPRIAVFPNRALSDEVREWVTPSRQVVTEKARGAPLSTEVPPGTRPGTSPVAPAAGANQGDDLKERGQATYGQTHVEPEQRPSTDEDWMWQFEESFLGQFLRAKAFVVDRATIVRLIAEQSGRQGEPYDLLAVRAVEMQALKEKADLFMELLVRHNEASPVGYEFRASVKEVETGRLLANISSLRWKQGDFEDIRERRYKTTDRGYEIETVTIKEGTFPKLDRVASALALDVMRALTEIWAPD